VVHRFFVIRAQNRKERRRRARRSFLRAGRLMALCSESNLSRLVLRQPPLQCFSESIARKGLDDVICRARPQTGDSGVESVETGGYDDRGFRMKAMQLLD
jgi:hypothetical protein